MATSRRSIASYGGGVHERPLVLTLADSHEQSETWRRYYKRNVLTRRVDNTPDYPAQPRWPDQPVNLIKA